MRADRLLRMLWLLRQHGAPVTFDRLATELEVSRRTVIRDIEALSTAGVPVYTQRGRHGGVALVPGYRPDVIGLSDDEAFAVTAIASVSTAGALGLRDEVESALAKLSSGAADHHGVSLAGRVIVDPDGWLPGRRRSRLPELLAAVAAQRVVAFRYTPGSTGQARDVESPALGLLCAAADWYLACETADGHTRFFRLDRIDDLDVRGPAPSRPGFDLDAEWHRAKDSFGARFEPLTGVLEVRASALGRLRGITHLNSIETLDGDWVRVHAEFADITHALEVLPRIAGDLRILGPAELAEAIRALASALGESIRAPGPCRADDESPATRRTASLTPATTRRRGRPRRTPGAPPAG